ncbi:hypothetical protein HY933_03730 [Candidatus Falkowbacteria bacterium]|nr:hypothetical protein [Candidatus Falkowbacteria bacterium]
MKNIRLVLAIMVVLVCAFGLVATAWAEKAVPGFYTIVYNPEHHCTDDPGEWTKVLQDNIPQYNPDVHGPLKYWVYLVGYSTEWSSLKDCPPAVQLRMAHGYRGDHLAQVLRSKGWDPEQMNWAGAQSWKAGGAIMRLFPGESGKKAVVAARQVQKPINPEDPNSTPWPWTQVYDPETDEVYDEWPHPLNGAPGDPGTGGAGGVLDRLFLFGGPEGLWTSWGVTDRPVANQTVKRDRTDSAALSGYAGVGFCLWDAWAITGSGRYAYVFETPKTRHNTWAADASLLWAPTYRWNFSAGFGYYWQNVAWHSYQLAGEGQNQLESTRQTYGLNVSAAWVFTKTRPTFSLRLFGYYGYDVRVRDSAWAIGIGPAIRWGGMGNFVPDNE